MVVKLTKPQSVLLGELQAAGNSGVFKSTAYTPAESLVTMGYAKWGNKFNNGTSGRLLITDKGLKFRRGEL